MSQFSKTLFFLISLFWIVSSKAQNEVYSSETTQEIADTTFVNLRDYRSDFIYDMKYDTEDNFLKDKVYALYCFKVGITTP